MPPKKQISMEEIIDKAFKIVKENGCECLTARRLAKELNCSTQPIYQAFSDMNDLKSVLVKRAGERMMQYVANNSDTTQSPMLSKILGYVQFASEEKHLFQLMFMPGILQQEDIQMLIPLNNELELNMLIYAHGLVMMKAYGALLLPWEQVKKMILNAYQCFERN